MATSRAIKQAARKEAPVWIVAGLVLLLGIGWQWAWSVDRFYEIKSVAVADARAGDPIPMVVDRRIRHPFQGEYTVTVRNVETLAVVCSGGSRVNYRPGAELPEVLTLSWWAAGAVPDCLSSIARQAPARFIMETCVEIRHALPFTPRDSVCRYSNIFRVSA